VAWFVSREKPTGHVPTEVGTIFLAICKMLTFFILRKHSMLFNRWRVSNNGCMFLRLFGSFFSARCRHSLAWALFVLHYLFVSLVRLLLLYYFECSIVIRSDNQSSTVKIAEKDLLRRSIFFLMFHHLRFPLTLYPTSLLRPHPVVQEDVTVHCVARARIKNVE